MEGYGSAAFSSVREAIGSEQTRVYWEMAYLNNRKEGHRHQSVDVFKENLSSLEPLVESPALACAGIWHRSIIKFSNRIASKECCARRSRKTKTLFVFFFVLIKSQHQLQH